MKRLLALTLICLAWLAACLPAGVSNGTSGSTEAAHTVTMPATQNAPEGPTASQTPDATIQPAPTQTPHPYNKVWVQNSLPPMGDPGVLAAYYAQTPPVVYGYLTRYVDNERAIRIALWQVEHFREQLDRLEPLLGGNYGPDAMYDGEWGGFIDGTGKHVGRSITVNYDDQGVPQPANIIELTPAQVNLYVLTLMTPEQREERLRMFDAIVAMKTPNDIGRIFCVYPPSAEPLIYPVARVLVMDTSSVNDYTGIGGTEGIPLGYRVQVDLNGEMTYWLADVPGPLFELLRTGDVARAVFIEDIENDGCDPAVQ